MTTVKELKSALDKSKQEIEVSKNKMVQIIDRIGEKYLDDEYLDNYKFNISEEIDFAVADSVSSNFDEDAKAEIANSYAGDELANKVLSAFEEALDNTDDSDTEINVEGQVFTLDETDQIIGLMAGYAEGQVDYIINNFRLQSDIEEKFGVEINQEDIKAIADEVDKELYPKQPAPVVAPKRKMKM